jgi:ribosome-associated protein
MAQTDTINPRVLVPLQTLADSLELAKLAARAAAENKGQDILVLDLSHQTSVFDCFMIATGTSRRQMQAIAEEIDRVFKARGERKLSMSGYDDSRWIAVDYGGVVVHLFDEEYRSFYDLEGLWADSTRVDLTEALRDTNARATI